ncbi:hypothetical protein SAMN06296952_0205 [Oscillospiraceae bacterium]|nr:hypothetical protein SAMN06296952_0205 [Oscillospiraceae bacterium]
MELILDEYNCYDACLKTLNVDALGDIVTLDLITEYEDEVYIKFVLCNELQYFTDALIPYVRKENGQLIESTRFSDDVTYEDISLNRNPYYLQKIEYCKEGNEIEFKVVFSRMSMTIKCRHILVNGNEQCL